MYTLLYQYFEHPCTSYQELGVGNFMGVHTAMYESQSIPISNDYPKRKESYA